jgi:hypothetical protein
MSRGKKSPDDYFLFMTSLIIGGGGVTWADSDADADSDVDVGDVFLSSY